MVDSTSYKATKKDFEDLVNGVKENIGSKDDIKKRIQDGCNAANRFTWLIDIDNLWKIRDEMFEAVEQLWNALTECAKGIAAPLTYLDCAEQWKVDVAGAISPAVTVSTGLDTNLSIDWQGYAAKKYEGARVKQAAALGAIYGVCGKIGDELIKIADAGWKFYKDVLNTVTDFMAKFFDEVGKFGNPFRLLDAIPNAVKIITAGVTAVRDLYEARIDLFREEYKGRIQFKSLENTPEFRKPGESDHWPSAVTEDYNDGSVLDGDNDWSVPPGVIIQS